MKITFFWDLAPYSSVISYRSFRGTSILYPENGGRNSSEMLLLYFVYAYLPFDMFESMDDVTAKVLRMRTIIPPSLVRDFITILRFYLF
jgi:hypothetical protein